MSLTTKKLTVDELVHLELPELPNYHEPRRHGQARARAWRSSALTIDCGHTTFVGDALR
jgi:hypothetical protein